jgi:large subunit ribosomal protein L32e
MVINKDLLLARKKVSDRRPKFVRQESWRYDRLAESWRKPKGKDNKMRRQVSGVPRLVKVGYRGPRKARGLHPSGYTDNLVFNVNDLARLDPAKDAARIGHVVGQRKRLLILAEARSKAIKVLNPGKEQKAEAASETKESTPKKKKEKAVGKVKEQQSEEIKGKEIESEVVEKEPEVVEKEEEEEEDEEIKEEEQVKQQDMKEQAEENEPSQQNDDKMEKTVQDDNDKQGNKREAKNKNNDDEAEVAKS